jgi:hypothetical protein
MSQQVLIWRARLLRIAGVAGPGLALAASVLAAGPSIAAPAPPLVADCLYDSGGANDVPGEADVTRGCAKQGSAPFEIDASWSIDHARLEGAATIRVCSLYNTDNDAFANAAVCTALKGATGNNGNAILLNSLRLFTCTDEAADRCTGATEVTEGSATSCTAVQDKLDPFPGPSPGPGWQYPEDTIVSCGIDAADFDLGTLRPLDTCSYSAESPDSAPSDCLLFRSCSAAQECDDRNPCTTDSCNPAGVCRRVANAGASCDDAIWCNGDEKCTAYGACGAAAEARRCEDGVECTLDSCDEISNACQFQPRNSVCSDDLFCTGVETCDPASGCKPGFAPNCSDGISCTADRCNEAGDGCTHEADEACEAVLAQLEAQ